MVFALYAGLLLFHHITVAVQLAFSPKFIPSERVENFKCKEIRHFYNGLKSESLIRFVFGFVLSRYREGGF